MTETMYAHLVLLVNNSMTLDRDKTTEEKLLYIQSMRLLQRHHAFQEIVIDNAINSIETPPKDAGTSESGVVPER